MEKKVYYSPTPGLQINAIHGKLVQVGAEIQRLGEKFITFSDSVMQSRDGCGSVDKFGMFVTDDPELIEFLDNRMASGAGDVISPEEYNRLATPPEIRATYAEAENKRLIAENNRLLQHLHSVGQKAPKEASHA